MSKYFKFIGLLLPFCTMCSQKENKEDIGRCGCGRSPTGYCIGWHNLDEGTFQHMKQQWIEEQFRKDAEVDDNG